MRFGCWVPQGWRLDLVGIEPRDQWSTIRSVAEAIERSGYDSLWVFDHFHTMPVPTQEATHEAWSLMAALAAATRTVRLGQMCTCNSYRHPSYLAKAASTVDVISGGRLEMGIGAGWYEHEYLGYGYEFPTASRRIAMLRESVEIMRLMWTEDVVSYEGSHYRLDGAINQPKPLQDPHIPLWVAGGGEKLTLRIAAEHAAYTNFGSDVAEFAHKSAVLEDHCDDVGTSFGDIVRSASFLTVCAETEREVEERIGWIKGHYRRFVPAERADQIGEAHRRAAGTPEQLVAKLRPWAEAGMGYALCYFTEAAYDTTGLELFAAEVVPALR